jgi:putative membrane protein
MHGGIGVFGMNGVGTALFWIVIIAVVAWLAVALMSSPRHSKPTHGSKSALEILKERYAAGEISREEYEVKKRDMTGERMV